MDWFTNNWVLFLALVVCVVVLLAVFSRSGRSKDGHRH